MKDPATQKGFTIGDLLICMIVFLPIGYYLSTEPWIECRLTLSPEGDARSDMRYLATAIEAYTIDHDARPLMVMLRDHENAGDELREMGGWHLTTIHTGGLMQEGITTPVAYLNELPEDRFSLDEGLPYVFYTDGNVWILLSPGRDKDYDLKAPWKYINRSSYSQLTEIQNYAYDPTNGTESSGDVIRLSSY